MSDFEDVFVYVFGVLILIGIILAISSVQDSKQWNNGYCECGGKWEYQQAVGHRTDTDYIYKCDKCGKIEEFDIAR